MDITGVKHRSGVLTFRNRGKGERQSLHCLPIFPFGKFRTLCWLLIRVIPDREDGAAIIPDPAGSGAAIRATRKTQGLRQDELAGTAGVGTRFVVELESGKASVQFGKALTVAQAPGRRLAILP